MKRALYEVMQDVDGYEELAGFFRGIHEENRRRAEETGRLLAGRVAE